MKIEMSEKSKKYYWLKLKRDFFKRHDIQIIEGMPNGKDYILFYLKLLCESVDHEGALRFSDQVPYNEQMLSILTNTNIDVVRSAMKMFIELKMVEVFDDETIFMAEVNKLIGSETKWAEKKRLQRSKEDNVPALSTNCPIEKENREEEIREEEKENRNSFIHSCKNENVWKEEMQMEYRGGTLGKGVVMLSDEQFNHLLEILSLDEFNKYIGIVADCELKGKSYKRKTHYQAILDMVKKDRGVKNANEL